MIRSMTGFGQSTSDNGATLFTCDVKSLNSKFLDVNLRLPKAFVEKEIEVRNLITEVLERGKIALSLEVIAYGKTTSTLRYNEASFTAHYLELKKLADKVMAPYDGLFEIALNAPEVQQAMMPETFDENEWSRAHQCILEALTKCDQFRLSEGGVLQKMLEGCIHTISMELSEVEKLDPQRVSKLKEKIKGNVVSVLGEEGLDMNRFEQEIIYYIEKLDINEEKVRLKAHLDYFLLVLKEKGNNGKKLGFIGQEIGREINTIGSKANDASMQKHVVVMKEELEKIKEQLNNVL